MLMETYTANYAHFPALLVLVAICGICSYIYVFQVFPFLDLPKPFERIKDGHLGGKIVIIMSEV
jgi:hypothetical protein